MREIHMQECDICGRKTEKEYVVEVEGAMMHACERCAKGMTPIQVIDHSITDKPQTPIKKRSFVEEGQEITEGYGNMIKNAREKIGITNKELAIRINEKESLIARIERNQLVPEQRVAKKLEKVLGIKLGIEGTTSENKYNSRKDEPLTLWDAAIKKESKKAVSE